MVRSLALGLCGVCGALVSAAEDEKGRCGGGGGRRDRSAPPAPEGGGPRGRSGGAHAGDVRACARDRHVVASRVAAVCYSTRNSTAYRARTLRSLLDDHANATNAVIFLIAFQQSFS